MVIHVNSEEINLYFLKSRYYDPEVGRFISPNSVDFIDSYSFFGFNLYAYCKNNPVMFVDPSGHFAISIGLLLSIGGIVGAAIGASASVAGQYLANGCRWENFSWGQLALDIVLGGVSGMLSMSPLGLGAMVATNAGLRFIRAVGGHLINGSDFSKGSTWLDIGLSTELGALVGNALRLSGQNLVKQWNKMIVGQAGKALTKALAYGGTALLIGTAGKGLLYRRVNYVR